MRSPGDRRVASDTLRLTFLNELILVHIFVARLTLRWRSLIFDRLHPRCNLLFMTICAFDRKMLTSYHEAGR
jgi:hypothetical protein